MVPFVHLHFVMLLFLRLLQLAGDLDDLKSVLDKGGEQKTVGAGHCSALIKLLPGNCDLFSSQVTWNHYGEMLRVIKKYSLNYHVTPGIFSVYHRSADYF